MNAENLDLTTMRSDYMMKAESISQWIHICYSNDRICLFFHLFHQMQIDLICILNCWSHKTNPASFAGNLIRGAVSFLCVNEEALTLPCEVHLLYIIQVLVTCKYQHEQWKPQRWTPSSTFRKSEL